ncbi:hypothetical protein Baya_10369 [Bagarius yarrelli]|uniref:Uncharacterized protein n=1 Tax=Bagarius yarrelli TaxID=175774 RepID=A0A556UYU4_BAGYA|nr:hypothetical protein Baya_10369 [Bagarius yarrelli]
MQLELIFYLEILQELRMWFSTCTSILAPPNASTVYAERFMLKDCTDAEMPPELTHGMVDRTWKVIRFTNPVSRRFREEQGAALRMNESRKGMAIVYCLFPDWPVKPPITAQASKDTENRSAGKISEIFRSVTDLSRKEADQVQNQDDFGMQNLPLTSFNSQIHSTHRQAQRRH